MQRSLLLESKPPGGGDSAGKYEADIGEEQSGRLAFAGW